MIKRALHTIMAMALMTGPIAAQTIVPVRVVASTSWTAAFARAAGATDIVTIAPLELKHPPEYEIKPSDLAAVAGAQFLVHSGYERFAKRLAETAGIDGLTIAQVYTDNIPATFKSEAHKLAVLFGTLPAYESWAARFDTLTASMKMAVSEAFPDKRVVAHAYLKTYAQWLGFDVVGTFGPGEPSPAVLLELAKAKPALIIDNYHNPSGSSIVAATGAPLVTLINFPGKDGTRTIEDVFALNQAAFLAAARSVKK
ncbi:MAG TPA: zinc ABC transporter substrate-binding protein [bacterium]|nr:zinc ABC transporter substrate-binding protein [bacterium]